MMPDIGFFKCGEDDGWMEKQKWFHTLLFKILCTTVSAVLISIIGWILYFSVWDSSSTFLLSESELKQGDFLRDKQAVVYFSTTAPQNSFNDGLSYAVFIDEQGRAKSLKMGGLELGSVASNKDQVFVEEQDKVRIVGRDYQAFSMKDRHFTGTKAGYLNKKQFFYSIYNTGNYGNGYISTIRWGDEKGFRTGTIPYYIESTGEDGEHIYLITTNYGESDKYYLKQVDLHQKVEIKSLTEWKVSEDASILSPLLVDENNFYIVLCGEKSDAHVQLLTINRKTYQREMYTLIQYANDTDILAKSTPFEFKTFYLFNQDLYYVDGFGDVYTFNLLSKKVQKKFSFTDYKRETALHDEHLYFQDSYVYFFRFNPRIGQYTIEKYNLLNGKREAVKEVTGIKEIMAEVSRRKKFAPLYDFRMLRDL
jgi:hypothetical protein